MVVTNRKQIDDDQVVMHDEGWWNPCYPMKNAWPSHPSRTRIPPGLTVHRRSTKPLGPPPKGIPPLHVRRRAPTRGARGTARSPSQSPCFRTPIGIT